MLPCVFTVGTASVTRLTLAVWLAEESYFTHSSSRREGCQLFNYLVVEENTLQRDNRL